LSFILIKVGLMLSKTASTIEHKNDKAIVKIIYKKSSSNSYCEYSLNFLNGNIYYFLNCKNPLIDFLKVF